MTANERRPAGAASETSRGAGVGSIIHRAADELLPLWPRPWQWGVGLVIGLAVLVVGR